jgi:hypothetical protein
MPNTDWESGLVFFSSASGFGVVYRREIARSYTLAAPNSTAMPTRPTTRNSSDTGNPMQANTRNLVFSSLGSFFAAAAAAAAAAGVGAAVAVGAML